MIDIIIIILVALIVVSLLLYLLKHKGCSNCKNCTKAHNCKRVTDFIEMEMDDIETKKEKGSK